VKNSGRPNRRQANSLPRDLLSGLLQTSVCHASLSAPLASPVISFTTPLWAGALPHRRLLYWDASHGQRRQPLSIVMTRPRLNPPTRPDQARLRQINLNHPVDMPDICWPSITPTHRSHLFAERYLLAPSNQALDAVDDGLRSWRSTLTGIRPVFSVYTLPQTRLYPSDLNATINQRANNSAPARCRGDILKKTRQLFRDLNPPLCILETPVATGITSQQPCHATPQMPQFLPSSSPRPRSLTSSIRR